MERYYVNNIVNADGIQECCEIIVKEGTISQINKTPPPEDQQSFWYAVPGFIDIHTHGGNGFDIMDCNQDAFSRIAQFHLQNGTTSFLGSSTTAPLDKIELLLEAGEIFQKTNHNRALSGVESSFLGFHLEGPWLSKMNLGAQNGSYIRPPDGKSMDLIRKHSDNIRMVTFSYHHPTSEAFLHTLLNLKIIPACGHDETIDADIVAGFQNGLNHITHLYSSTSSFRRVNGVKHLGTLEMSLITDGVTVEVIADNHHITKFFWDFIIHNKSFDEILIVSDSIMAAGLKEDPNNIYKLGDLDIIIDNGVAWLSDKSIFAGSVSTMYKMFKILINEWNVDICNAVKMTSFNQANKLSILDSIGSIEKNKSADFILLNNNLDIKKIIKSGIPVPLAG